MGWGQLVVLLPRVGGFADYSTVCSCVARVLCSVSALLPVWR